MDLISSWKPTLKRMILNIILIIGIFILMIYKSHIVNTVNKIMILSFIALSILLMTTYPIISFKDKYVKYFERVDFCLLLLLACFFIQSFFTFGYYRATVDGNSMYPTLIDDDALIVSSNKKVNRGDIVIIYVDDDINSIAYGAKDDVVLVKRVIGLPGDEIHAINGILYINGEEIDFIEGMYTSDFTTESVIKNNINFEIDDVIPDGYYLVLGDNRGASNDSRYLGLFSEKQILGIVKYKKQSGIFNWVKVE